MNELWTILNSLNNRVTSNHKVSKNCIETGSGICPTTEARSYVDDEEEKRSVKDLYADTSSFPIKPTHIMKADPSGNISHILVPNQVRTSEKQEKANKYEKKNIFYKAVFRDIRRYFIELLKSSSSVVQFEENIARLLRTENEKLSNQELKEMTAILAPFLNYNKYLIEFEQKSVKDAQMILDWLQNFTLTKMRKVLQYNGIKFVVKYYFKHTVKEGSSERLKTHKTMKKNAAKYLEVLRKIIQIAESP